jgi:hypothetical protein
VVAMNYPPVSTTGKINTKVFFYILHSVFLFNRFAEKHKMNGIEYRTSTKVYGLRFVLSIRGKGRRTDIVHLFVAIGSGLGHMVIAEIVCESIFTKFHKYRKNYRENKVETCRLNQSNKNDSIYIYIQRCTLFSHL